MFLDVVFSAANRLFGAFTIAVSQVKLKNLGLSVLMPGVMIWEKKRKK